MTGLEFAKYLVDMMYSHWAITIVFLLFLCPWNTIKFIKQDKRKKDE